MSPRPPAVLVPLLAAVLLAGCDRQTPPDTQPQSTASGAAATAEDDGRFSGMLDISNRGAALPDLTFSDPAGKKLRTLDLKGKPLLINLWATWCGPCVLEMPTIDALAAAKAGKLQVLAISQDTDQTPAVAAFFKDRQLTHLAPWLDPDNALSQHYNTGVLPTTVLYDADGREVWRFIGSHNWASARTDAMLASTLR
ncbi:MAG: TlpA family protein disulfide reductase [Novosphingobium sp.]|nr:TlpA family protein disulfide reductase [Novosphingobium sp.]